MRRSYNWRAYFASLADALGRQYIVLTFLSLSLAAPAIDFAWSHCLFTVPLDSAVAVVVLVISQDFSCYWFHRCSHRVRWFWATHAVNHSMIYGAQRAYSYPRTIFICQRPERELGCSCQSVRTGRSNGRY